MAIITKPIEGIIKGVPAVITLNKVELANLPIVSSDSYFCIMSNWNKIVVSYKNPEKRQYEILSFDATQEVPSTTFEVTDKAFDLFEIQNIQIIDFDGGILKISRSLLNTAELDVQVITDSESDGFVLLLEDNSYFLLESGEKLMLE
jgi:hypothetical protein